MPPDASTADTVDIWSQASSPAFLRRLDRLRINVRGGTTHHPGNNPVVSATQDSGLEFTKHRAYVAGDDLRHIDWNALARHDTKLVKTFRAEREAPLHILVDTSASMGAPAEDAKLAAAAGVTTGLAYISLRNRDPVRVAALEHSGARQIAPLLRHPQRLQLVAASLPSRAAAGMTDLESSIESYLHSTRLPGIAIVLSDFLVPRENYQSALRRMLASGYAVAAVRVIGKLEKNPPPSTRRVRLYDVESGRERMIDLTPHHRTCYLRTLDEHHNHLQSWCASNAIPFCVIDTDRPPSTAMTDTLPRAGILR